MNTKLFIAVLLFGGGLLFAQNSPNQISTGDVFRLNQPSGSDYQHVHFPRKNFILKRGAIADFKKLYGLQLEVVRTEQKNDITVVTLKRRDGQKFFRHWKEIKANLEKAIATGELSSI